MGDIEERLRSLNEVPAPDLWPEIDSGRQPRPSPERRRGRLAAAAVALVLLVVVAVIANQTLPGTHHEPAGPPPSGAVSIGPIPSGNVTVSALTPDGSARCTANFPSTVIQPGDPTGVIVSLENLSDVGVEYDVAHTLGDVVVKDETGAVLWDGYFSSGRADAHGPGPARRILTPAETVRLLTADDPIRWPGPLKLSVVCLGFGLEPLELPSVEAHVAILGPPPDPPAALDRALQKTGGLFDDCRPTPGGTPTPGLVRAPDGSQVPPMAALCAAAVVENPGFDVVTLTFETPADGPPVEIPDDIYHTRLPGNGQLEVGRWVFLVTDRAVFEVSPLMTVGRSLQSTAAAPYFEFQVDNTWSANPGGCGANFSGPGIWFISVCQS
jgi:hypothetical protein